MASGGGNQLTGFETKQEREKERRQPVRFLISLN